MTDPVKPDEREWTRWLCPECGLLADDGELLEGQDASHANASDPDGWTDQFFHSRHDPPLPVEEVVVVPESRALAAEKRADELAEALREAVERIFELLVAFGPRPTGEDAVTTDVTRECAFNVARDDLEDFYRVLGRAGAGQIRALFPDLKLPAAEADRAALSRYTEEERDG